MVAEPYSCAMSDASQEWDFAALIRDGRRRKGWSQDDLEAESGVSRSTLSRWERGISDRPEPPHVRAVCLALGIDPRRAAVALGYLTPEEVRPPAGRPLDPEIAEVLDLLQDPSVPVDEKREWIKYLRYLRQRRQNTNEQAS
jgi:transcriptional regulator with XRE-family HTH domain